MKGRQGWRQAAGALALAFSLRYLCHCLMLLPVLWNERRPAPHLPDLILDHLPWVPGIMRYNYFLWMIAYMPPVLYLLWKHRPLFWRFILLDGTVSLLRGLAVPLTGLGPPFGTDLNALAPFPYWSTWFALINPWQALIGNTAGIFLTKDLFFSGHVATTFLLTLHFWRLRTGRWIVLSLHLATVAVVFLSHIHYTLDVVAAYAIVYSLYKFSEPWLDEKIPLRQQ